MSACLGSKKAQDIGATNGDKGHSRTGKLRLPHLRWRRSCCRLALGYTMRHRQANDDASTAGREGLGRNRAAMCFDDRSNYGQAHSHALLFGGKKMIKNLIRPVLRQSHSKIAHTYFDHVAL